LFFWCEVGRKKVEFVHTLNQKEEEGEIIQIGNEFTRLVSCYHVWLATEF
jgi:hypothetical protein